MVRVMITVMVSKLIGSNYNSDPNPKLTLSLTLT